ncbi:nicotinamide N-methyltransferase-like protein [Cantharellus anzutake]|uniref:nicotinamide N-methyltransferase-like protein n=1 Tax=Cantharellus anzutake TaxID=1750568 RepID=UPI0019035F25|nr:nicotinamide N-methyltransferase-like protein [Cantharellus anzutake]KAF8326626.1 nicotinamide N-methyltransferase-like protein [Cantharellus anzutake]
MVVREETSYDLDKKIWDSGMGLCSWIHDFVTGQSGSPSPELDFVWQLFTSDSDPINVIELGTGTGLVSIWLAVSLGNKVHSSQGRQVKIVATDLPSAIPLIEHNIQSNAHLFAPGTTDENPVEKDLFPTGVDLIIMADVTYNIDVFPALIRTLGRIRAAPRVTSAVGRKVTQPPPVLLVYKERDSAERTLFDLCNEISINFKIISHIPGAGGNPIEVYVAS